MSKDVFAVWTIFVSLVVGFIAMVMFYGHMVGVSFPLFIALLMAAVLGSGWYGQRQMNARNMWLMVPALGFAIMVAVRADEWLTFWNVAASLALSGLALHYLAVKIPFDLTSTLDHIGALIATSLSTTIFQPIVALVQSWKWFQKRESGDNENSRRVIAIVRGLAVTLPVLVIFGVLLGSADLIFADYLGRFTDLFNVENIDDLVGRGFYVGVFGWFSTGVITYAFTREWDWYANQRGAEVAAEDTETEDEAQNETPDNESTDDAPDATTPPKRAATFAPRVSMIEGGMLLGGVNLLFGAFVLVQFVYLFGGRVNVEDFTYAEYARRGFFELVTVAVMTMALLLTADRITVRDGRNQNILFRALSILIVVFVSVMLVSAARRMALYTDTYGLTRLRLWVNVSLGWMAVLFVILVLSLFRVRKNIFSLGLVVVAIGYLGTLNAMKPDALIANYNLQRVGIAEIDLDVCYIDTLSSDAIPVILDYYENTTHFETKERLAMVLRRQPLLFTDTDSSVFAFNSSRTRADRLLGPYVDEIMPVEIDFDLFSCYGYYGYEDEYAGYR